MAVTRAELVTAVEAAVGSLASAYRGAAAESDLCEAALLVVAMQAAEAANGTCLITSDGRSQSAQIIFRRAPGNRKHSGPLVGVLVDERFAQAGITFLLRWRGLRAGACGLRGRWLP